jgi:hypothetical protein
MEPTDLEPDEYESDVDAVRARMVDVAGPAPCGRQGRSGPMSDEARSLLVAHVRRRSP